MIQSGLWGKLVRHSIALVIESLCLAMASTLLTLCFDTAQALVRYCLNRGPYSSAPCAIVLSTCIPLVVLSCSEH